MSRDDVPNFRHITAQVTCVSCEHIDQSYFCSKYEFFVVPSPSDYTCDGWEVRNQWEVGR